MKTLVNFLVDRSGSMSNLRSDVIGGFNELIKKQKAEGNDCLVSFCKFDNEYEEVFSLVPLAEVRELTDEDFVPRGGTALIDSLGRNITEVGAKLKAMEVSERPDQVLFVLITDGQENSSHEMSKKEVFEMVSHQRDNYSWEFMFIGANQDSIAEASAYGFRPNMSANFAATSSGTAAVYGTTCDIMTRSATHSVGSLNISSEDRTRMMKRD